MTQAELALHVGMRLSIITRLEDADYDGDALALLARIAHSLGQRIEVRMVPWQAKAAMA